jgi:hypothetical protein
MTGLNGIRRMLEMKFAPGARRKTERIMKKRMVGMSMLALVLAGCWQKSLHPFYTATDVVTDPKLYGTWTEQKESDGNRTTWTFTNAGDKRLEVVTQDKESKHEFEGRLFKLGGEVLLDLEGKARALSTIPAHHLLRVQIGQELKLAPLNTDWVQTWLRKNPGSLAHIALVDPEHRDDRDKDELVLTAETKALQKFVREHINDTNFFVEPTVLKK